MLQCVDRIEWIGDAAELRRLRHELCDTERAFGTDRARVETALLPYHPGKKFHRKVVVGSVRFDCAANILRGRCNVWPFGRVTVFSGPVGRLFLWRGRILAQVILVRRSAWVRMRSGSAAPQGQHD